MNRDYDIDSILAEIKQKKASEASRSREPERRYEDESPRDGARAAARNDAEDDYAAPRQPRREPERCYEDESPRGGRAQGAGRRGAESDYAEPREEKPAPRREPERYYEDESPRRAPSRQGAESDYAEPQSRQKGYEEDDDYERKRPLKPMRRPSFERAPGEQYNPADAIFALAGSPEGQGAKRREVKEPEQRRQQTRANGDYSEPDYEDYAPNIKRREPAAAQRGAERGGGVSEGYEPARAAKPVMPAEERGRADDDEFIMKYSGLAPLGSGARRAADSDVRDSIRSNFGAAASPAKGRQQRQEPAPPPRQVEKPELKGGFRLNPREQQNDKEPDSEAFTRLDIPIADGLMSGENFDDTRALPQELERNMFALQETEPKGEENDFTDDDPPVKLEMDEYSSPADAAGVKKDLDTIRGSLMLRFAVNTLCALALLYMGLAQSLPLPLPEFIAPDTATGTYMLVSLIILAAAALVSHRTISHGLIGMFTLKANNDSLAAIAVVASFMQGTALFLTPSAYGGNVHVYFAVAAIGLLFNVVGKLFTIGRITGNFRFISSPVQKYTVQNLSRRELAREFTWDMNIDEPYVSYSEKVGFIDGYIEQAYAEDSTENIAKITVPIIFVGSIVVAAVSYIFGKDLYAALSTFAAVLAISSPITATIVGSLPQHKAYRALTRGGAALTGYNAVEKFSDTNVVLADACELFTSDEVLLHNIKTFEKNRIDEAILDASSVLCVCNGAVKNIFLRIIQGNTKMLRPVENLVYEDAMGVSAWVGGKRILIGNSDLMKHHGIDTPSRDYEAKYRTEDRDILYLANSGELTAMFVISYVRNDAVDAALSDLERKGISVVVKSVDPNLTAAKIAKIYDLPEEMLRILPAKLHSDFDSLAKERKSEKGYLVHTGSFAGFARAVSAASGVKIATNIGLIIQIVGMVLGYTLITFFSFMGSMEQATMTTVLLYQVVWGAAVWLFSALRRI